MINEKQKAENGISLKFITISIAAIGLFLTFLSVVYYRHSDRQQQKLDFIDNKINALLGKQDEINNTPRVLVKLKTVRSSGLPEAAFSKIKSVPALLELENLGGEAADDITVIITSEAKITGVTVDDAMDKLTHNFHENLTDIRTVKFDITQLRPQKIVSAIIYQDGLGNLQIDDQAIGSGTFVTLETDDVSRIRERFGYSISFDEAQEIFVNEFTGIDGMDDIVEIVGLLKELKSRVQSESFLDWTSWLLPLLAFPAGVVPMIIIQVLSDLLGRPKRRIVINIIKSKEVVEGANTSDVERLLGKADSRFAVENSDEFAECWLYPPKSAWFNPKKIPGLAVYFGPDDKAAKLTYLSDPTIK